jgi:hypothetical protein
MCAMCACWNTRHRGMEKIVGESVKDRGLEESVQERMEAGATGKDLNMQKLK